MKNRTDSFGPSAVLGLVLLMIVTGVACAQDLTRPLLLVATPHLRGVYSQTVLIAMPAGNGQHVGFIINRASPNTLASLFPGHAPSKRVVDPVYYGGPVGLGSIFAFVRAPDRKAVDALPLFEDLFIAFSTEAVDRIIEQTPNAARYVSGYVGWLPNELEAEIDRGFWYFDEPHAELLFRKETGALWNELVKRAPPEQLVPRSRRQMTRVGWRH